MNPQLLLNPLAFPRNKMFCAQRGLPLAELEKHLAIAQLVVPVVPYP